MHSPGSCCFSELTCHDLGTDLPHGHRTHQPRPGEISGWKGPSKMWLPWGNQPPFHVCSWVLLNECSSQELLSETRMNGVALGFSSSADSQGMASVGRRCSMSQRSLLGARGLWGLVLATRAGEQSHICSFHSISGSKCFRKNSNCASR